MHHAVPVAGHFQQRVKENAEVKAGLGGVGRHIGDDLVVQQRADVVAGAYGHGGLGIGLSSQLQLGNDIGIAAAVDFHHLDALFLANGGVELIHRSLGNLVVGAAAAGMPEFDHQGRCRIGQRGGDGREHQHQCQKQCNDPFHLRVPPLIYPDFPDQGKQRTKAAAHLRIFDRFRV